MAYAILRVAKIKSHSSATSKTQHNYRTQDTPNADPDQFSRNQELLNLDQRNYWDLADERIAELGLKRLRTDAVRAMEVLLTASPEAFAREANGRAKDMRGSKWVQDNLDFLQERFGAKNVVSFTLHQDEVTPHIHAVVVPITDQARLVNGKPVPGPPERLSARDVFSPAKLRQLQTDYAKLMSPYGLERGVLYSTAIHQDVRRHYGAQNTSKEELAQVAAPLEYKPFKLAEKQMGDWLSPQAYLQREQARMNEYLAQQIATVNAKLAEVATVATANTLEHERAKVLEQRLATSHREHEKTKEELGRTQQTLTSTKQELATQQARYSRLIVQAVQKEPLAPELRQQAVQVRRDSHQRAQQLAVTVLAQPFKQAQQLTDGLQQHGFAVQQLADNQFVVRDGKTGTLFPLSELRPNGQELADAIKQAIERTKQDEERAHRRELAQAPGALQAVVTARDAEQAGRIQADLEKSGANVWQVRTLANNRVEVSASYAFDWQTIEGISRVLDKAQGSKDVAVEETYKDQHTRTSAARTAERERERRSRPDRGIEM